MSMPVRTTDGKELESFMIMIHPDYPIKIGDIELPLTEFCALASHWLSGGLFGWSNKVTPDPVNKVLEELFQLYERSSGGVWRRKC